MPQNSLQRIRMKFTPPSSRSFHDRTDEVMSRLEAIESQLNENYLLLKSEIDSLSQQISVHDAHSKLRWQGLFRDPDETPENAKRRFFKSIPPAMGSMRAFQLANARLLHDLDTICEQNNIEYWMCFGSLVATVSRAGSIPWDDDIDVCMMREDVENLVNLLKDDSHFQITLAYDAYVFCKQLRFSLKDSLVPCFVDICVWDWAKDHSKTNDDRLRELRLSLMDEFASNVELLAQWQKYPVLYAPDSNSVVQADGVVLEQPEPEVAERTIREIEAVFSRYDELAHDEKILCEKSAADGLAYGLSNIYDAPWRRMIFPREMILPVVQLPYEGYLVNAPAEYEAVCDECYPGWPYLPQDILGHEHLSKQILSDENVRQAILSYAENGLDVR